MKLARAETPDGVRTGRYRDGRLVADGAEYDLEDEATLLAPCDPSAVYCVGRNYAETVEQMDYEVPEAPDFFIKPPAAVHPPGRPVPYPTFTDELTYAGELAAVVGERCRNLTEAEVDDAIRGYTVLNDLDCLDQPGRTARKAFHGSAPIGPVVETAVDPTGLAMETTVGGERRQSSSTDRMLFGPRAVVSFLSGRVTLRPGDVISFGSPANPGLVEPGEAVVVTYEGVGTLRTPVVASRRPS